MVLNWSSCVNSTSRNLVRGRGTLTWIFFLLRDSHLQAICMLTCWLSSTTFDRYTSKLSESSGASRCAKILGGFTLSTSPAVPYTITMRSSSVRIVLLRRLTVTFSTLRLLDFTELYRQFIMKSKLSKMAVCSWIAAILKYRSAFISFGV